MDADRLRAFIRREFLFDKDAALDDRDELFPAVIDSLGLMDLVAFLEDTYGIQVTEDELVIEHFRTVADVVRLVEGKAG